VILLPFRARSRHQIAVPKKTKRTTKNGVLSNSDLAELLALAAEEAKMPLQKALRRASRKAFMWADEAAALLQDGRSLTELPAIGPTLSRMIRAWIEEPPVVPKPPAIRANFFTAAEAKAILTRNPDWAGGLKGDLQMHTLWSDGSGSVEEMARAAIERGYQFIAITDHSKGLKIAGGITEEELQEQGEEIEAVNAKLKAEGARLQVLRSTELNLSPGGASDMESSALEQLDIVLGCFHSALRKKEDQTERYVSALRNPDIQILGHPRGRIYNFRLGLQADWERVFGIAAELDKAIEIDGYPDRQDLSLDLLKIAKKAGCRISLGTDSHDPLQIRFMDYSLAAAIVAGIPRERILNFMTVDALRAWVKNVRDRAGYNARGGRAKTV
jgi:histidinol phosphatase-like PHP family hydrolase